MVIKWWLGAYGTLATTNTQGARLETKQVVRASFPIEFPTIDWQKTEWKPITNKYKYCLNDTRHSPEVDCFLPTTLGYWQWRSMKIPCYTGVVLERAFQNLSWRHGINSMEPAPITMKSMTFLTWGTAKSHQGWRRGIDWCDWPQHRRTIFLYIILSKLELSKGLEKMQWKSVENNVRLINSIPHKSSSIHTHLLHHSSARDLWWMSLLMIELHPQYN